MTHCEALLDSIFHCIYSLGLSLCPGTSLIGCSAHETLVLTTDFSSFHEDFAAESVFTLPLAAMTYARRHGHTLDADLRCRPGVSPWAATSLCSAGTAAAHCKICSAGVALWAALVQSWKVLDQAFPIPASCSRRP